MAADYNYDAYPQFGYGEILRKHKAEDTVFINLARQGCSTRSFLNQKRFEIVEKSITKDDLLIVQFGNNDESKKHVERYTERDTEFLSNIDYFYSVARTKGAECLIITSPARRNFINGLMVDNHLGYPQALVKHCELKGYPYIDLNMLTTNYYDIVGEEKTKEFHLIYEPNQFNRYIEGNVDNSHFNFKGANMIAKIILTEMKIKYEKFEDYFIEYKDELK